MIVFARKRRIDAPDTAAVVHKYRWHWWRVWHGMRLSDWVRLLARNRFRVHPRRLALAGSITAHAAMVSGLGLLQQMIHGRRLAAVTIDKPPIFIIGHWRSGTTYLHELLCEDERFTAPTSYECGAVYHCLLTERILKRLSRLMMPRYRPMDNMAISWDAPQEEEIGLATMGAASPYLSWAFPNHPPVYSEYLDMDGVSQQDLARWKQALMRLLRLITYRRAKRLVLKSPPNTGRTGLLAEMFPGAKFIHMVRDPFALFSSTMRLWNALDTVQGLQPSCDGRRKQYVFECFERMYRAFDEQRRAIDPSCICDVRYEDLVRDPAGQVRRVYEQLGLGGFEQVRPRVEALVAARKDYRANRHQLDGAAAREVTRRWAPYFQQYGYSTES